MMKGNMLCVGLSQSSDGPGRSGPRVSIRLMCARARGVASRAEAEEAEEALRRGGSPPRRRAEAAAETAASPEGRRTSVNLPADADLNRIRFISGAHFIKRRLCALQHRPAGPPAYSPLAASLNILLYQNEKYDTIHIIIQYYSI